MKRGEYHTRLDGMLWRCIEGAEDGSRWVFRPLWSPPFMGSFVAWCEDCWWAVTDWWNG